MRNCLRHAPRSFHLSVLIVVISLAFDFTNGWHDAASSIATVVSTRVLKPFWAVLWAAFWNFLAPLTFGTAVAATGGKGLVHLQMVSQQVLFAGLLGAIIWNYATIRLGMPCSSSHSLMGEYGGAAIAAAGFGAIIFRISLSFYAELADLYIMGIDGTSLSACEQLSDRGCSRVGDGRISLASHELRNGCRCDIRSSIILNALAVFPSTNTDAARDGSGTSTLGTFNFALALSNRFLGFKSINNCGLHEISPARS